MNFARLMQGRRATGSPGSRTASAPQRPSHRRRPRSQMAPTGRPTHERRSAVDMTPRARTRYLRNVAVAVGASTRARRAARPRSVRQCARTRSSPRECHRVAPGANLGPERRKPTCSTRARVRRRAARRKGRAAAGGGVLRAPRDGAPPPRLPRRCARRAAAAASALAASGCSGWPSVRRRCCAREALTPRRRRRDACVGRGPSGSGSPNAPGTAKSSNGRFRKILAVKLLLGHRAVLGGRAGTPDGQKLCPPRRNFPDSLRRSRT